MNRLPYILFPLLLSISTFAQRFPITVTTILTPPYTSSLSEMAESGSMRLMVNLLVNDVTVSELPVKLHVKMEGAGITIESIPTQVVRPMFLGGGEARVLTGDDFAQCLNLNNLSFRGFSKAAYQKSGHLPGGLWKFSVSVRHFYTNKVISNVGTATAWITSYKPPVLTAPKNNDIEPSNAALPLTFSWQASKHVGGTAAIMYRFEMWERRVEGVPAQTVAATIPPIFTTETAGLTATVQPATLALEPGMKYCWRVTAYDPSGMVTFENKGESEVRTFQYLEKCPEVCGLAVELKDNCGYASWEENRIHAGGYNFELYDDAGTVHETLWGGVTKTAAIGCEYGQTWHVRVQGICRQSVESPWSDWVDFTTPEKFVAPKRADGTSYECGAEIPERVITNFTPTDNIQKGDTLEDERGTTKYIVHSAIKNGDGSFRGLSYMKLSIWGVKVLGEYDRMRVNTDGVIIGRYAWKAVKSDKCLADQEAFEKWADELALEMASATYNNTIKDTVVLKYSRGIVPFETIVREGNKHYAVTSDGQKEEITSFIDGKTRVLVKDGNGHELVIDKDGNVMGVEEYKKCGGSSKLLSEHNAYRDSTMSASGNITFGKVGKETYGFDYWRGADYDKDEYDSFNGYHPAYLCAQKNSKVKVAANRTIGYRFISERGVPIIANTADNTLPLTIGTAGKQTVYAYSDSTLVGKLCIQAYDPKEVKVHLVRVNNGQKLELDKIAEEVNRIYSSAVVHYTFDELDPITIEYANKQHFVHGGKGTFQNYNTDQKAAIKALPETADGNDYYLFFTDCYNRLDTAGNVSPEAVNGYMPVGRHYGFIYNEYDNARTIAHELGHGTNSLHHTFSQESESFCTTKETYNLMDYHGGTHLNHKQWQWAHEKHRNVLGFLDDEGEGETKTEAKTEEDDDIIKRVKKFCLNLKYADGSEKVFDNDLIDKYLSVDGDKYRYRKYIANLTQEINILNNKNIKFTKAEFSSYSNGVITIGANDKYTKSDVAISLFHEYLHRINDALKIFEYRLVNGNEIFSISKKYTKENTFHFSSAEQVDALINRGQSDFDDIFDEYCIATNLFSLNISEYTPDLHDDFVKYVLEKADITIIYPSVEYEYKPTNYVREELSVYHWCIEYGTMLGGFSKTKQDEYSKFIEKYKRDLLKFRQYEKDNDYDETGYNN